jgi:dolichol-phosphate mannosyltransferase
MNQAPAGDGRGRRAVSIVVPTYREAENLRELVERVSAAVRPTGRPFEVIVVDDDSPDETARVMAELADEGHPVRLITRTDERGLSSAVLRGFREAEGDVLVCMDADLSHPPEALAELVRAAEEPEADFVIGSRYVRGGSTEEGWGLFRWLNSKVATLLARPFTRAKDPMAGFFALRREVFERAAPPNPIGYKIGLELMVKCGCRQVREVPIHFADRKRGESKLSLREQVRYLQHLKRLADFKFGVFSRLGQFCSVGATGMVVDLGLLAVLLHAGIEFYLARAAAIWVAMTWNFAGNRLITFSDREREGILWQYSRFVASCSLGAAVSWLVSVGLERWLPAFAFQPYVCAVAGIAAGLLVNFTLARHWVFRRARRAVAQVLPPPDGEQPRSPQQ